MRGEKLVGVICGKKHRVVAEKREIAPDKKFSGEDDRKNLSMKNSTRDALLLQ